MELDDLKTLLKTRLETGFERHTASQLETAMRAQASAITGKIKRSIWLELVVFAMAVGIAIVCWFHYPNVYIHLFCIATAIFCLIACSKLFAVYKKIVYHESEPSTTKQNLEGIIEIVSRFTRLYFNITIGLLPVIFAFGFISIYIDVSKQGLMQQFHFSQKMIGFAVVFIIAWSALIYFLAKWYIRKLYGNYLFQLKQQLKDIENG